MCSDEEPFRAFSYTSSLLLPTCHRFDATGIGQRLKKETWDLIDLEKVAFYEV